MSIGSPLEQKSEVKIYKWGGGNFAPKPTSLTSYKASLLRTCLGTQICLEMKFSLYKTNQILTQSLYSCGSISEFPQKKT